MIWHSNLLVIATLAGVATLLWLTERKIYVSASAAAAGWSLIAITAATIQRHTLSGEIVTRSGWMIQAIAAFLAAVSFLAIVATYFGHYPPENAEERRIRPK